MKPAALFLLILTGLAHGQITFEKYYSEVDRIFSIAQTPDEGYVIGTESKKVIKLDKYGDVQWSKQFRSYNGFSHDVISCDDSTILLVTTSDGEKKDIFLYKLNLNGELIWKNRYGTSEDDAGYYVRQLSDGGFLIFGTQFIKTDKDGNIIWQKDYPISYGFYNSFLLAENSNIYIVKNGQLNCFSSSGDLQWSKNFKLGSYTILELNGYLFFSGQKTIYKLDMDGNTILSKSLSSMYSIAEYDESNFAAASKDSMMIINSDLEVQSVKQITSHTLSQTIKKTSDDGYVLTGEKGWLLKTDKNGDHKSILLLTPQSGEIVRPGVYSVKWSSYDVLKKSIEYSSDNGSTWNEIATTEADSVQWNVPAEYGNYILRANETGNPDIHDLAGPFAVSWNSTDDYIAANQIFMWIGNNGMGSHNKTTDGSGLYWPIVSAIPAIFQDGLVWGGKINDKVYVNGNTYRDGLVPGKILPDGSADDQTSYKYKLWKINKFWESMPDDEKKEQLRLNYENWPGDLGAPYKDVNGDGIFTRGTDRPEFPGDEVLWTVANDLDSNVSRFAYGSNPIGLEVQITTYAFARYDELGDVVFKKYKLINKSENIIEDMYLTYWSDPDLGDALDDFVGCDSSLNLAYCYNGDNNDQSFYGSNPPAVGYKMVQGPVIDSPGDTAFYNDRFVPGKRNMLSSAFHFYIGAALEWVDPIMGSHDGSLQFYNQMQGKKWDGKDVIDPVSGKVTRFALSGDPVSSTGWYEGAGWPGGYVPGDRRMIISSGPFQFAPGDTQEVVFAIIFARGTDNINSVAELKSKAQVVQDFFNNRILTYTKKNLSPILTYNLEQNYPNPFNPSTTIRYSIAQGTKVTLKVYDILGKEVMTLVNEDKNSGKYEVIFNANKLSSGIYYYQLKAGEFVKTVKMILLK